MALVKKVSSSGVKLLKFVHSYTRPVATPRQSEIKVDCIQVQDMLTFRYTGSAVVRRLNAKQK